MNKALVTSLIYNQTLTESQTLSLWDVSEAMFVCDDLAEPAKHSFPPDDFFLLPSSASDHLPHRPW